MWGDVSDDSLANVVDQSHTNTLILIEAIILSEFLAIILSHFDFVEDHALGKSMQIIAMRHM